jgi:hypothetical protein
MPDLHHLFDMPKKEKNDVELIRGWTLLTSATLGSAVRAKGILQEIQAPSSRAFKEVYIVGRRRTDTVDADQQ